MNPLFDLGKGLIGVTIFSVFATLPFLAPVYLVTLSTVFLRTGQLLGHLVAGGTKSVEQHIK